MTTATRTQEKAPLAIQSDSTESKEKMFQKADNLLFKERNYLEAEKLYLHILD
jgi:hypothetical protein